VRWFVGVENLTDERYVAPVFSNGINREFYEAGLPRAWNGGLMIHWR